MAEYFALQAAFFFAVSHILIRRGLVTSNAVTGSFISLGMTAVILAALASFLTPAGEFWHPAVFYFLAAGIFAPGIGRTLTYVGIEKIGVARSVPISSTSPILASVIAVFMLGETWLQRNFLGTLLVICGVAILSRSQSGKNQWRRVDIIYPVTAALAFAVSTNLRKLGLIMTNRPLMAAAFTASTAFLFVLGLLTVRSRWRLRLDRSNCGWFVSAGLFNTAATLSFFHALSVGAVVVVEPLTNSSPVFSLLMSALFLKDVETITPRVIAGALCTVIGTILVVTR